MASINSKVQEGQHPLPMRSGSRRGADTGPSGHPPMHSRVRRKSTTANWSRGNASCFWSSGLMANGDGTPSGLAIGIGSQGKSTQMLTTAIGAGAETTADSRLTLGNSLQLSNTWPHIGCRRGLFVGRNEPERCSRCPESRHSVAQRHHLLRRQRWAESTCYGENARSQGGGTTAMGANSVADSGAGSDEIVAATALGARTEATGAGSTALSAPEPMLPVKAPSPQG